MLKKKELKICMGSSCFSRGNKKMLQIIQKYIRDHALEELIDLKGNHCFSECNNGPTIRIEGTLYEKIDQNSLLDILENEFGSNK